MKLQTNIDKAALADAAIEWLRLTDERAALRRDAVAHGATAADYFDESGLLAGRIKRAYLAMRDLVTDKPQPEPGLAEWLEGQP